MKFGLQLMLVTVPLMGCGGGGSSGDVISLNDREVSLPAFQGVVLSGSTFDTLAPSPVPGGAAAGAAPMEMVNASLEFLDDERVIVNVNGVSTLLAQSSATQFMATGGDASLFFSHGPIDGAVSDEDVIGMIYFDTSGTSGARSLALTVGEDTAEAAIPATGIARYEGNGNIIENNGFARGIRVLLEADFDFNTISGEVQEMIYSRPDISMFMADTELDASGFSGDLSFNRSDLEVEGGTLTGKFYGDGGGKIAGTITTVSDAVTANGYYITERE